MAGTAPESQTAALVAALAALSIATVIAAAVALRLRMAALAVRLALGQARAQQTAFAAAAIRLTAAARDSLDAVRTEIANAVCAAVPAVDGALLYEEHDGSLRCVAAFGERFAYYAGATVALDDATALPARALTAGHRVTLADHGVHPPHPGDTAAAAIPLSLETAHRSVLVIASQAGLDAEDLDVVAALAAQAAPAYLIAIDREQDRYDAEYDGLTGLLTPRAFRQSLAALIDGAQFIPSVRLGLLFIDTDRFKDWNDRFGHAAGDALLRELANVFRAAVSARDLVGRNGGDEFCIVFTDTDKSSAIERAEKLRRRIAALDGRMPVPPETAGGVPITASIGVAAYPADASCASELLERADAAMYHSKSSGRNGVSYCTDHGFARLPPCEPP
ncbi:MAG: putative signaling protein [Candidatus Eremiobacteraeota bacterium]|nr:putative signaling protein [Candidatus Eremiobacteraeota bacterium]